MPFYSRQLSRTFGRRFVATVVSSAVKAKNGPKVQWKKIAVLVGATGLSVAVGNVIYDYVVLKNLEEIDYAVRTGLKWDPEWDFYELLDDSDMLVQPTVDEVIKKSRKKWESDNNVNRRLVIMVRHGSVETENAHTTLSDAGIKEMELTAERISLLLTKTGGVVRAVAHGGSEESKASAAILSNRLNAEMEATPLLDEGFPEMPDPPVASLTPDMIQPEETARLESGYRTYFDRPSKDKAAEGGKLGVDIIVGHGNQLRYLLCRALQLSSTYWLRFSLSPASITMIDITNEGRVQALRIGDSGHLSP
ncbi:hypothetical protein FOL47_007242 [Perkinsus chesapeaki]|uniref:Serine/threonine-protein phosphatase PGAM5, mitochondrial n=1 Tax=Perkinsus chesapeaki TaxID=330153 RepID=A0A7J6MWK7_PERCH|nr:hypothetical protein FOL47_007242 [Perkinsus chesapeaki]